MQKFVLKIFIVISICILGSACAIKQLPTSTTQTDIYKTAVAKHLAEKEAAKSALEYIQPEPKNELPAQNSELEQKMDAMIAGLNDLTSVIREEKTSPAPTPAPTEKSVTTQTPALKIQIKKSEVSKSEFNRLKKRVDELGKTAVIHGIKLKEEKNKYQIFRIGPFAEGSFSLKHNNIEEQVDDLTLIVDKINNLKHLRIIGYTNTDGHKDNLLLSGQRAQSVLNRLVLHRPNDLEGIEPEKGGETRKFGVAEENRCVIVVCEKNTFPDP